MGHKMGVKIKGCLEDEGGSGIKGGWEKEGLQ